MNKHSIVNLKCPCFLFRYPKLDIPSQALFNLHRASALPLRCSSEDDQNFQSPPGHLRLPVRRRQYFFLLLKFCHSLYYIKIIIFKIGCVQEKLPKKKLQRKNPYYYFLKLFSPPLTHITIHQRFSSHSLRGVELAYC